jgi:hypothetical protein
VWQDPPRAAMDQRKALFRAKLREREAKEKQERRIDPSLVRYISPLLSLFPHVSVCLCSSSLADSYATSSFVSGSYR